jgi:hypothetical protein
LAFFSLPHSWLLLFPSFFFTGPDMNLFWELLVIYGKLVKSSCQMFSCLVT